MNKYISDAKRNDILTFDLTDNYRSKHFTKNFNNHLNSLFECASLIEPDVPFEPLKIEFNEDIYWETEAYIFENLDNCDNEFNNELFDLEDELKNTIKTKLGSKYDRRNPHLMMVIDNTIKSEINNVKFDNFRRSSEFINPWIESRKILSEDKILHTFTTNWDILEDIGVGNERFESEEIRHKRIGVIGRGYRDDFTYGYFRDMIKLRNTVYGIISEKAPSSSTPISTNAIILELRNMGIPESDLKDNEVKNWLIYPLKKVLKIGSCREGYFIMENCLDLSISYLSHFNVLKGYLNTLENHRKIAIRSGCGGDYDLHLNLFNP